MYALASAGLALLIMAATVIHLRYRYKLLKYGKWLVTLSFILWLTIILTPLLLILAILEDLNGPSTLLDRLIVVAGWIIGLGAGAALYFGRGWATNEQREYLETDKHD